MRLTLTDEQQALDEVATSLLAGIGTPEHLRDAEATGFSPAAWKALDDLGILAAAASGDATLTDLGVVARAVGATLAPVPFVEAAVATLVLAQADTDGRATDDGDLVVFSPVPGTGGIVPLVPGGSVADAVIALDGDRLLLIRTGGDRSGREPAKRVPNLAHEALADIAVDPDGTGPGTATGIEVLAQGPEAVERFEAALDAWRILTAWQLVGLGRASLDLGVAYACDRVQFDVPIGAFQAIQHRLADVHTAVSGADLLTRSATLAAIDGTSDRRALAAMAYLFAADVATTGAEVSLHVHGGYGFTLEYDIQIYLRRAKALKVRLGDPRPQLATLAHQLWPDDGDGSVTLTRRLDPDTETFRQEIRRFIAANLTTEMTDRVRETGTLHDWGLHRALCDAGYLAAGWPTEVGGQGRSAVETTALIQEFYYADAPVDGALISAMVAATLLVKGNEEQQQRILPEILRGDALCCLGYSEPDAGSDVAAAQTRAVRDGDEWVIDGQKMFTTMAHESKYVFLLTRTSPEKSKHRGLTMFLVPLDTPGISVTRMDTLGGQRTNVTYYADVRVPDSCRVGDVDAGWSVMHSALIYERNSANWGEPAHIVDEVARWAQRTGRLADAALADRLAWHTTTLEVGRLLLFNTAQLAADGAMPLVDGSMTKLFISESFTEACRDLLDAVGPLGLLRHGADDAPMDGLVEHAYRHSLVSTIYGGSSEIQRGIIAQHGLGLPRGR